ncbi:hypothetical protein GGI12_002708 [Dipsacomyces acuminosporus]|nr:hypothetical protein GGI12_002708 [Dipsacomyces acuminosporus]
MPAMLNLHAELERAQSEAKGVHTPRKRKRASEDALDKQNRGVQQRATRDTMAMDPSAAASSNAQVKQILERKARMYDILSKPGSTEQASDSLALEESQINKILDEGSVDFVSKQWTQVQKRRDAERKLEDDSGSLVEITDEFGRSRLVPKSQAKKYQAHISSSSSSGSSSSGSSGSGSDSDSGSSVDRLYTSAARAGYYKLSTDLTEREQQLEDLRALHSNTLAVRKHSTASTGERQRHLLSRRWSRITAMFKPASASG